MSGGPGSTDGAGRSGDRRDGAETAGRPAADDGDRDGREGKDGEDVVTGAVHGADSLVVVVGVPLSNAAGHGAIAAV